MTYPKVIDNRRKSLIETLEEIAPNFDELSIATGYWDLKGMASLMPSLKSYKKIRILIGQEPLRPRFQKAMKFETDVDFPDADLKWDLTHTEYESPLVDAAEELANLLNQGLVEVKIYRGNFLHAKAYIFTKSNGNEAIGIIGSSNFTGAGLSSNTELNALEDDNRIVRYKPRADSDEHGHLSWFEEIWSDELSENWNGEFSRIISESPLGKSCFTPYEMYMKTLWELYRDEVDIQTEISSETSMSLFAFQQRNARLLIQKLRKYGVAMLADSVGLGKTITAGAVIKEYIETYQARRIYVIVPASLVQPWKRDLAKVHKLATGFEVLSMQDYAQIQRTREIDRYADVDLFVIDEAHNLRNPNGTRHEQLLDWFSNNPSSHVLMLTATPINNKLTDFVNQIQLAAKGKLSAFPVVYPTAKKREVIDFFEAVKRLTADMQASETKGEVIDFDRVSRIMRQGLRHFLVRTTRRGIEAEFGGLLDSNGNLKKFPKSVVKNHPYAYTDALASKIESVIETNLEVFEGREPRHINLEELLTQTQRTKHPIDLLQSIQPPTEANSGVFDEIFRLILLLGFTPYKTTTYLNQYYGKTHDELAEFDIPSEESFRLRSQMSIHNIMRVTFLKRMESSQAALHMSITQYLNRLDKFERTLDNGLIASIKDINLLEKEFGENFSTLEQDELSEKLDIELVPADPSRYKIAQIKVDISRDRKLVALILKSCEILNYHDDKLISLVELISQIRTQQNAGSKILLFSYFTDTIRYLEQKLPQLIIDDEFRARSAYLTGSNRTALEDTVKRFSPKSTDAELDPETRIDFLFATDVLSEGQNLQDCGTLINFDLHWNPVRMIQRNGRINRMGSPFEKVLIYNLHPENSLDSYLKLVKRLERKIDTIKYTIGTDQSVLGEQENPIEFLDGFEEDEVLKEILELYKNPENSDVLDKFDDDDELLSEDEYIIALRRFLNVATPDVIDRVKNIALGKWGYLPKNTNLAENRIISLTETKGVIENTGQDFSSHFFIESDPESGYMVDPIDMIEALSFIRCTENDSVSQRDSIPYDRRLVKKLVEAASSEEAKDGHPVVRLTPSKTKILDFLKVAIPGLGLALSLNNVSTRQQLRKVEQLFLVSNRELRTFGQLLPTTLNNFVALQKELSRAQPEQRSIESVESVLFYVS